MDSLIVFVAKYFFVISVVVVAVYWLTASLTVKMSLTWQLLAGGVIAIALSLLASHFYYDTRPFVTHHLTPMFAHAADNGFPSDHALFTSFLAFTMFLYSKRTGIALFVVAVLVGWARVAAHVHNPRDIVGAFVIAAIAVVIARLVARFWRSRKSNAGWR